MEQPSKKFSELYILRILIKRIDEDYSHVDYSGVCNTVFYSELDDL